MIYLYVKTHNKTGMKYFGKTTREDPYSYNGSGKYWLKHLKKHGADISTEIIASFEDEKECSKFALEYSIINDIANSEMWANLREENGLDGAPIGHITSDETKQKISQTLTGKPSVKTKYIIKENPDLRSERMSEINKGRFWINNGVISKKVKAIEDGWVLGRLKSEYLGDKTIGSKNLSGNNTRGKVIYNDGKNHKYFIEGQQPDGWKRGKIPGYQGGTGALKKGKKYGKEKTKTD
jgi:hypothetical protein